MVKKIVPILVCALLILSLCSCTDNNADVKEVISKISAKDRGAPAGKIYFSEAEAGDDEYISETMLIALFGSDKAVQELELVDSFAIRLSRFTSPYEYAVFKAKSPRDTEEIATMCRRRIEAAKVLLNKGGTEHDKAIANSGRVYITGRFVFLVMTDDNESIIDAAKDALR